MPKRKTTEEFIADAIKVHGDEYDYSKVNYESNYKKVCIICKEHGEFWQTPKHHLKGCGCPICSLINRKMTNEEFVKRAMEIHGDKYDYGLIQYINPNTKIDVVCKNHGKFSILPFGFLKGCGCKRCGYKLNKPLLFGVGINDIEEPISENGKHFPFYTHWKSMLNRCYNKKSKEMYNNYKGCEVCEEWKYLSNFKMWFDANYIEGYELDKDILYTGNKVYSPDTCCFVPKKINNLIKRSIKSTKRIHPGIVENKNGTFSITMRKHYDKITIGGIKSFEEAVRIYTNKKEEYIYELAKEYYNKNMIKKNVYNALMNYRFTITNERE